jgi:hypothetical protein
VRIWGGAAALLAATLAMVGCGAGMQTVPAEPPRIAVSSAGCKPWNDEPATPISHRRVGAPDPRTPYFASRAGRLPSSGAPKVAGIQLPKGSRCPHYWAADGPSPDALELARRLAAAFPQTGLWPVIWDWEDDPDSYAVTQGDPRAADHLDGADVLRRDAPRSASQALALAAEQNVFSPDNAESDEAALARTLLNGAPGRADSGWKGYWDFGWPD